MSVDVLFKTTPSPRWQGAVRSDFKSATLPSKFKRSTLTNQPDPLGPRVGMTLPRNYGGTRSPVPEDDEDDQGAAAEELRNFKTPELKEPERKTSFGFGGFFGGDDNKKKDKTPTPPPPPKTPEEAPGKE